MASRVSQGEVRRAVQGFADATQGPRKQTGEYRKSRRHVLSGAAAAVLLIAAGCNQFFGDNEAPAKNGSAATGKASPSASESGIPVTPTPGFNCRLQAVGPAEWDGSELVIPTKHEVEPTVDGKQVVLAAYRYNFEKKKLGDLLSYGKATKSGNLSSGGTPLQSLDVRVGTIPKDGEFGVAYYAHSEDGSEKDPCGAASLSSSGTGETVGVRIENSSGIGLPVDAPTPPLS